MKLDKGTYTIDICCKNGKSHIFDNKVTEVFEGELIEIHKILLDINKCEEVGLFEYVVL